MLRIALCDDQQDCLQQAAALLEHWPSKPCELRWDSFSDGDSLLRAHAETPYDIIFLDVLMPLLNGIETAKELRQHDRSVRIVFLTSSPEFALESYRVKASDYLLKPLQADLFYTCLTELLEDLDVSPKTLTVRTASAVHRVPISDIQYVEAQNKHTLLVLSDGRSLLSLSPLHVFEDALLPHSFFFKCHRSYLVNLLRIGSFSAKDICMANGALLPLARSSRKEFEDAYFNAYFGKEGARL